MFVAYNRMHTMKISDNFLDSFIYRLFNDDVRSSDHIAMNLRMYSERKIGKNMEGSSCGLFQGTILLFTQRSSENHEMPQLG
jgi:hypothetical protein